jgi:acyl CoA:acetate/3-ketoacid CoA transferase
MNKVTLKAYAVKHKLSIFNVMKMVKSSKLESEEVEVNGKKVLYVILDEKTKEEVKSKIFPVENTNKATIEQELEILRKEHHQLRKEFEELKITVLQSHI